MTTTDVVPLTVALVLAAVALGAVPGAIILTLIAWRRAERARDTADEALDQWSAHVAYRHPDTPPARTTAPTVRSKTHGALVYCAFCGKSQKQVSTLIAGPGVHICSECINLCNEIIEEEVAGERQEATSEPVSTEDAKGGGGTAPVNKPQRDS